MIGSMKNPPWLARFPVGLFSVPVGLLALAGAWRRAQAFDWPVALPIAQSLAGTGVFLLALLLLTYLVKCLRHPQAVHTEFTHPLAGSLMALLPLSLLLCSIYFGQPGHLGWLALVLAALTLQGIIAIRIVAIITSAALPTSAVSPALYIPPVAGGFVGGMALDALGYPGWAALLFGMGLASWALLEVRVLNRLFEGPMPEPLRPTIGLEMAPPTVGTLAAGMIWPQLPGDVLIVGLGVAAGPIVAVLARYQWWHQVPFSTGFWSFSFPLAALAGATVEVVRRGGWPSAVGAVALAIASTVIGFLLLRTLMLLLRGQLIPTPPPAISQTQKLTA
jgi:tellurite resistance protein